MSTRAQLIARAAEALQAHSDKFRHDVPTLLSVDRARAVVDAVLPQVTTVEELEALPVGTKLLGRDGEIWWRRGSTTTPWQGSGGGYGSSSANFAEIAGRLLRHEAPLTVIWRPEP